MIKCYFNNCTELACYCKSDQGHLHAHNLNVREAKSLVDKRRIHHDMQLEDNEWTVINQPTSYPKEVVIPLKVEKVDLLKSPIRQTPQNWQCANEAPVLPVEVEDLRHPPRRSEQMDNGSISHEQP